MQTRQLLIFIALSLIAAGVVIAAVTAYQRTHTQVLVDTPDAKVETNKPGDKTSVDAPYAHIESGKEGTKIEAPGVKIEVPPKQPQN